MGFSIWHLLLVLVVVFVLFGAGKLPKVMGDFGKGIRSFKDGLNSGDEKFSSNDDKKDLPPPDKKD